MAKNGSGKRGRPRKNHNYPVIVVSGGGRPDDGAPDHQKHDGPERSIALAYKTQFNPYVFEELCDRVSGGMSVTHVCDMNDMPAVRVLFAWLSQSRKTVDPENEFFGLVETFDLACDARMQRIADDTIEEARTIRLNETHEDKYGFIPVILQDGSVDPDFPNGRPVLVERKVKKSDGIERSRMIIETSQWILARQGSPHHRAAGRVSYAAPPALAAGGVHSNNRGDGTGYTINIINDPDAP